MSKTSIVKTNEALLASRPIFTADLLQKYRVELLRTAAPVEIKAYAEMSLGTVVSLSNMLEACLHVIPDPARALDELNEELDAADEEDEYGYEEDEEVGENKEVEEDTA